MTEANEHANQMPTCRNCGKTAEAHEKTKVYPDDGPAGSWHWEYECPDGYRSFER